MLLMMSENIARNMQSSQEIINYPTQLHFVGHFRILYLDARKYEYQMPDDLFIKPKHVSYASEKEHKLFSFSDDLILLPLLIFFLRDLI
jgi:hypothetical protein